MHTHSVKKVFNKVVLVSALGYFVDIYDLILFGIVRVASLKSLGVTGDELIRTGVFLLNMQMIGMLVGGILWGVLGDKKGRVSVLFGSILLYSLANIANAFVTDTTTYAVLRFIAGVGLAGELGAAITLVSEVMTKEMRGYGTAIVATVGASGAILAAIVGDLFTWQTAYIIGGVLGLLLLIMRMKMYDSGIFTDVKKSDVVRGRFISLFTDKERFKRYLFCILIGLPIWYVVGILITFSPEFAKVLGYDEPVAAGKAIMFTYIGLIIGDFASGILSQLMKSRKKIIYYFISSSSVVILVYLFLPFKSASAFYILCTVLGTAIGYWVVFVTIASEQFGTNIRATVTTTVPNFVRGAVVPLTVSFEYLRHPLGMVNSALVVGIITMAVSFFALYHVKETYGKDLNFVEDIN